MTIRSIAEQFTIYLNNLMLITQLKKTQLYRFQFLKTYIFQPSKSRMKKESKLSISTAGIVQVKMLPVFFYFRNWKSNMGAK